MFDQIIVVDWSANSTPKIGTDSIWIAVLDVNGVEATNVPTRYAAERVLESLIDDHGGRRTLIGVDFSLGYPTGTAEALGLDGDPWSEMWTLLDDQIIDGQRNENNRFEVAAEFNTRMTGQAAPFWGCPPSRAGPTLTPTMSVQTVDERLPGQWRLVERTLREAGKRPFSSWQLLGAGCVGSQSLLGIPMIHRLAMRHQGRFAVWPFTTELRAPVARPGDVVVAEIWPSLLSVSTGPGQVRDEAQVCAVATWLGNLDREQRLAMLFAPDVGAAQVGAVVNEEGWVLGVAAASPNGIDPVDEPAEGSVDGPGSV